MAILDIMGVEGYSLLEVANGRGIAAVMLTAHALSPDNVVKSYNEGAASYLPKEEMVTIASFLEDILAAQKLGKNPGPAGTEKWRPFLKGISNRTGKKTIKIFSRNFLSIDNHR